jgi:hypothetical protein
MSKKKSPDPLEDLLNWIANESDYFTANDADGETPGSADRQFDVLRTAWLNAGCPGTKEHAAKPAPPTIRVRIAVFTWLDKSSGENVTGVGSTFPGGEHSEENAVTAARKDAGFPGDQREVLASSLSWIEADVPAPPGPKTWKGEVVE